MLLIRDTNASWIFCRNRHGWGAENSHHPLRWEMFADAGDEPLGFGGDPEGCGLRWKGHRGWLLLPLIFLVEGIKHCTRSLVPLPYSSHPPFFLSRLSFISTDIDHAGSWGQVLAVRPAAEMNFRPSPLGITWVSRHGRRLLACN